MVKNVTKRSTSTTAILLARTVQNVLKHVRQPTRTQTAFLNIYSCEIQEKRKNKAQPHQIINSAARLSFNLFQFQMLPEKVFAIKDNYSIIHSVQLWLKHYALLPCHVAFNSCHHDKRSYVQVHVTYSALHAEHILFTALKSVCFCFVIKRGLKGIRHF